MVAEASIFFFLLKSSLDPEQKSCELLEILGSDVVKSSFSLALLKYGVRSQIGRIAFFLDPCSSSLLRQRMLD